MNYRFASFFFFRFPHACLNPFRITNAALRTAYAVQPKPLLARSCSLSHGVSLMCHWKLLGHQVSRSTLFKLYHFRISVVDERLQRVFEGQSWCSRNATLALITLPCIFMCTYMLVPPYVVTTQQLPYLHTGDESRPICLHFSEEALCSRGSGSTDWSSGYM